MAESYSFDGARVDWYGEEVLLLIEGATEDALEQVAFDVEGLAKQNIVAMDLIDTGFMLNSGYTVTPKGSTYAPGGSPPPGRGALAEAPLESDMEAIVAFAADYSIFVEGDFGFLFQALQAGAGRADGHLVKSFKDKGF